MAGDNSQHNSHIFKKFTISMMAEPKAEWLM